MSKVIFFLGILFILIYLPMSGYAQCSICTKTAQQLGQGPASALNSAIVYLMMAPLLIMGYIGFRWWRREKKIMANE